MCPVIKWCFRAKKGNSCFPSSSFCLLSVHMVNEPGTEGGGLDAPVRAGFKEVQDTGGGADLSEPQFPHV